MANNQRVLIAAGGTGGHIYPALAIAAALHRQMADLDIEFVGTPAGLENQLIPRDGYLLHHIPIGRLNCNVPLAERLKTAMLLPWAMVKAVCLVWRLKPRFVLGVGGHVTGPVVLAASLLRRPTYLWEPNAHPGLANRWLAPFVKEALVVFEDAAKLLRARHTRQVGMPVRLIIENLPEKAPAQGAHGEFHVLVFGGSQGSRGLNDIVCQAVIQGGIWPKGIAVVHQTGPADFARIKDQYDKAGAAVEVHDYLHDMDRRYEWADLVVARAGTGTVSELAACGKAAILVPLPTAADNHQQRNAEALLRKDAALMVLQKDLSPEKFQTLIRELNLNREKVDQLARNIRQFHEPHAALNIARHLLEATRT